MSKDLKLGFFSNENEVEFSIIWSESVCTLNLSFKLNYKWQFEHLSDFQLNQINHIGFQFTL